MTRNPIDKVLSTLRTCRVKCLLMGGQACVLYGAAEFSRSTDIVLLAEPENLERLAQALALLEAKCIAVPPLERDHLLRGHAVHFRCHHPEAEGIRLDVMSVLRGVAGFEELWKRRTTMEWAEAETYEVMSLEDLVQAKKTQRDKDWPMLRRLVEAHFEKHREEPTDPRIRFWLREARTPELLEELAQAFPHVARELQEQRPLLRFAASGDRQALESGLRDEEDRIRAEDRAYWAPLRRELEHMRRQP